MISNNINMCAIIKNMSANYRNSILVAQLTILFIFIFIVGGSTHPRRIFIGHFCPPPSWHVAHHPRVVSGLVPGRHAQPHHSGVLESLRQLRNRQLFQVPGGVQLLGHYPGVILSGHGGTTDLAGMVTETVRNLEMKRGRVLI